MEACKYKKKEYVYDSQEKNVILKLVNLFDKSGAKEKTLSESCSRHRRTPTGGRPLSGHRKHRHGHSIDKHERKAEHIQSDPCSCILEPTRLRKNELEASMKNNLMAISKPILEYYEGVHDERLISNRKGRLTQFGCKVSKTLCSSTAKNVNQNKPTTGTFMNKILTKYSNRKRTHLIRLNPFGKRSFYAMNLQVQRRQKREHKLEPYECEPGVCVPGQCDPYECQKRVMRRLKRKASTMTGGTSQSTYSETDRYYPDLKSKQQQFATGRHAAKPKVAFQPHGLKYETLPQKPAVVRVGSNISFNIEFSKSTVDSNREGKSSTGTIDTHRRRRSSTGSGSEYDANNYRTKVIQDFMARNQDKQSQSSTAMQHKGASITPRRKRCFCTLKLQKRGKQHKGIDFHMTENPHANNNKVSHGTANPNFISNSYYRDGYSTTRPYKLEPYECEPGVCTPGLCDPYECQKRIRRRLRREFGTSTQGHHARSTLTGDRRGKRLRDRDVQSIQTYDDRSPMNRYHGEENVESFINHNQVENNNPGVRIGSTISFNVEFYKRDGSASQAVGYPNPNASSTGNERGLDTVSKRNRGASGYPHMRRSQGVTGYPTKRVHRRSQYDRQRTHSRASGIGPLLKRCFCTLKLKKYEKQQQVNKPIRSRDMSVATSTERHEYDPIMYREMATKTRKMYSHLEPYECKPGTCVPGYCNPVECYERIQRRNLKTSSTETREYPTKSISMLTGQRRAHKRKIQTSNMNNYEKNTLKSYAPMDVKPENNQGTRVGSNISINIEFYKKNGSPNYIMPDNKSNGSAETLRLHDKHGNTNIYKRRLSQKYTDTQTRSSDSETQSRLETSNKASAAGKALKRCFCTARFHHPGTGYMRKQAVTVGRIDKIQALSPFKPTHYCVPDCPNPEPCKCITEIKASRGTKVNVKYLKDNSSQRNNTKSLKTKMKTTDSNDVTKRAAQKDTPYKGAGIMLNKTSNENKNLNPVKIMIHKSTKLNEKHLENNISQRNKNKSPKVKIEKVNEQSVQKAAEIESNSVISLIKLKLKHYFDLCTTMSKTQSKKQYTIVKISGDQLTKSISELRDKQLKEETTVVMVGGADVDCKSSQGIKPSLEDKKQKNRKTKPDSFVPIKYKCDETCSHCKYLNNKGKKKKHDHRTRSESSLLSLIKRELCKCLRQEKITQYFKLNKNNYINNITSLIHTKLSKMEVEKDKKDTADKDEVIKPHKKSKQTKTEIPDKETQIERSKDRTPFKLTSISKKDLDKNISQQSNTNPIKVENDKKEKETNKSFIQILKTVTDLNPTAVGTERNPAVSEVKLKLKQMLDLCTKKPTIPIKIHRPQTVVEISGDELTKHMSVLNDQHLSEQTTVVMVGGADLDCKISQSSKNAAEDSKETSNNNEPDASNKYKCCETCLVCKTEKNVEDTVQNTNDLKTILPYASDKYQKSKSKSILKTKKLSSVPIHPEGVKKLNLTPKPENIVITKQHTLFSLFSTQKTKKPFPELKNLQSGDRDRKNLKTDAGITINEKHNKPSKYKKNTKQVAQHDDSYTIAEVSGNKVAKKVCFSSDPTNPEAVIVTGVDVSCKISKVQGGLHNQHQPNITEHKNKNRNPCVCGSPICAKESQKKKDPNKSSKQDVQKKPLHKPCECGNPICKRAVSLLNNYQAIKTLINPRSAPPAIPLTKSERREKKKLDRKRKKLEAIRNRKRQAEYIKGLKSRQKIYKKEDKVRIKQRLKDDVQMLKQIRKYRNTSDSLLLTESLCDIAKLGCTAVQDIARSTYRAVIDPKHSYENLKILATDPHRAVGLCKRSVQQSGVISTLHRVKMRLTAMKRFKLVKKRLEETPVTRYMVHIADSDPKARMKRLKKKKKKNVRKREPMDFNCSLYMATLRKRPYLSIYYMCPWFYPHCLSLLNVWRQLSDIAIFLLAMLVWSPCILFMEACRALLCCTVCTG